LLGKVVGYLNVFGFGNVGEEVDAFIDDVVEGDTFGVEGDLVLLDFGPFQELFQKDEGAGGEVVDVVGVEFDGGVFGAVGDFVLEEVGEIDDGAEGAA
jgi:hypothetical protein